MKLIPLTQDKFAQVDDEDFDFLMQWKWCAVKNGTDNTYYAKRIIRLGNGRKNRKTQNISMHRELLELRREDKKMCDHIDRNGLNNQKSNLRICAHSQNMANRKSWGSSKYKGVSLHLKKYWIAQIQINNKRTYVGQFKTEENAAIAYNIFAEKYHGEFSNYNKAI